MANSLLDRYQAGEHQQVWQDLVELGAAVRTEFYYNQAKAVADETMRRARHNVEALVAKLTELGFEFGAPVHSPPLGDPFDPKVLERSAQSMLQFGPTRSLMENLKTDPSKMAQGMLQNLKQYGDPAFKPRNMQEEMMQRMTQQITSMREQIAQRGIDLSKAAEQIPKAKQPPAFEPASKNAKKPLDTFEKKAGGPLPISVRSWYELVGGVNLEGTHEALVPPATGDSREALMVMSLADAKKLTEVMCEDDEESESPDSSELILWGQDGDTYSIQVPDVAADGALLGWRGQTFVGHLRRAFAWGGFPGWENTEARPQKEIDYLREGLLPL